MPCYMNDPINEEELFLCEVCKNISYEQLEKINIKVWQSEKNLFKWYENHLFKDFMCCKNSQYEETEKNITYNRISNECKRLGITFNYKHYCIKCNSSGNLIFNSEKIKCDSCNGIGFEEIIFPKE